MPQNCLIQFEKRSSPLIQICQKKMTVVTRKGCGRLTIVIIVHPFASLYL